MDELYHDRRVPEWEAACLVELGVAARAEQIHALIWVRTQVISCD
jgi:hypothetical protein